MAWLGALFVALTIFFGIWGYAVAPPNAWPGARILFWICFVLSILLYLGAWGNRRYPEMRP